MGVFKDRLLFMFSSKNEHNLLLKPNFQKTIVIIMIILSGFIVFLSEKLYCYFELWGNETYCNYPFRGFFFLFCVSIGCVLLIFYWLYIILCTFVILDTISDIIIYGYFGLIDEIKLSFQPHSEVVKKNV